MSPARSRTAPFVDSFLVMDSVDVVDGMALPGFYLPKEIIGCFHLFLNPGISAETSICNRFVDSISCRILNPPFAPRRHSPC
jgi:hypothetical protein